LIERFERSYWPWILYTDHEETAAETWREYVQPRPYKWSRAKIESVLLQVQSWNVMNCLLYRYFQNLKLKHFTKLNVILL